MRKIRDNKGFTLIELMIVVVIIGILAAIAIPKFSSVSKGAKEAEGPAVLKQIRSLELSYYQRKDAYALSTGALTGFEEPNAKYYTFSVNATGTCAIATPRTAGVVESRSLDIPTGYLYEGTGCTGTRAD